jgi:hypothetical protein
MLCRRRGLLIDEQDIPAVTQAWLRAQTAVVPQEPMLFHRSLAQDIGYARPDAPAAAIEPAARLGNAHDFDRPPAGRLCDLGGCARRQAVRRRTPARGLGSRVSVPGAVPRVKLPSTKQQPDINAA